jgi:4-hydroxybenzoate polyprenyltransferase
VTGSAARRLGYRVLGRGFDYLLHLRPAEWPIFAVHVLTGTALGMGVAGLVRGEGGWDIAAGCAAFVIGLNGGTLALNSAFDRDEGDVAYLRKPPPPPRGLAAFGLGMMGLALAVATRLPIHFFSATALCFLLSVLYSVPPARLKAVAGVDWLVNMVGFGFLTPYAGWALTGRELEGPGRTVLISFALLFGALYPLTQLYQLDEDRRRGDRTFAVALGVDRSLTVAPVLAALAFLGFAMAATESGWSAATGGPAKWTALATAAGTWALVLVPWWRGRRAMGPAAHQAGMHRALVAWAVTDLAVLFCWAR